MQDRATANELLSAIERFLRSQSGAQKDRWLRFQLLVAANSLAIVGRELEMEESHLREEWPLMDELVGPEAVPPTFAALKAATAARTERLCAGIRAGEFDAAAPEAALMRYFVTEVTNRVRITAPAELQGL
jgi:hypothetical protein